MRRRDELEGADIEPGVSRRVSNALRRADQDRIDEPELVGFDRAAKRDVVARERSFKPLPASRRAPSRAAQACSFRRWPRAPGHEQRPQSAVQYSILLRAS